MPLNQEELDRKIHQLTFCYRIVAKKLLGNSELGKLWAQEQNRRQDQVFGLEILWSKTQQKFREERQRMDQGFAEFVMLLESSIEESSAASTLRNIKEEIQGAYPEFCIGILISSQPKQTALVCLPKSSRFEINANDRRFLRSLRIVADQSDQQD
ncbi:MAG: hypothetical protein WDN47_02260 [Candidatus Doudnabacteria bacterium]